MTNVLQMLSPEMREILRSRSIWPDQVLYLTRPDRRIEMFALGHRRFEIFLQDEDSFRQVASGADRRESSAGYNVLPRKFRAVLYESDDTDEPRRLLLALPQTEIPGLRDPYPMLIWTTDQGKSLMESLGDEIALQAYRDGFLDGVPVVALRTGEVLADEDPRGEEKERRRAEAVPDSLLATLDDGAEVSEALRKKMKERGILPEEILSTRVSDEMMASLSERQVPGILLRYDDDHMERLFRHTPSSDLHDLGSYHPRPYKVVLLRDNREGELLCEPEIAPREDEEEYPLFFPHPSMHEEMEAALPFFSIMASVDAEYLCSLGLTMEDAYIFIPLRPYEA